MIGSSRMTTFIRATSFYVVCWSLGENFSVEEKATTMSALTVHDHETVPVSADVNVFRDTPMRFMGYANEVGESFRYRFPKLVIPSYGVAFGYCLMDAAFNGYGTGQSADAALTIPSNGEATKEHRSKEMRIALATFDTLLWQS